MGTIDEQTQRQSIFDVWPDEDYPGLHRDILAAINAAVQAEREACAQVATDSILLLNVEYSNPEILRRSIAAAIRARK